MFVGEACTVPLQIYNSFSFLHENIYKGKALSRQLATICSQCSPLSLAAYFWV